MTVRPHVHAENHPRVHPCEIEAFLRRSGWTQAQLAWAVGVRQPRISRFIKGLKRPNPELDQALSRFLLGQGRGRAREARQR
ncbi:helix-turn-helix transcriptional regulator [Methylobacterium sp. A54F]